MRRSVAAGTSLAGIVTAALPGGAEASIFNVKEELRGRGAISLWSCREADGQQTLRSLCYLADDTNSPDDQPTLGPGAFCDRPPAFGPPPFRRKPGPGGFKCRERGLGA